MTRELRHGKTLRTVGIALTSTAGGLVLLGTGLFFVPGDDGEFGQNDAAFTSGVVILSVAGALLISGVTSWILGAVRVRLGRARGDPGHVRLFRNVGLVVTGIGALFAVSGAILMGAGAQGRDGTAYGCGLAFLSLSGPWLIAGIPIWAESARSVWHRPSVPGARAAVSPVLGAWDPHHALRLREQLRLGLPRSVWLTSYAVRF